MTEFNEQSREGLLRMMMAEQESPFAKKIEDLWERGKSESEPKATFHMVFRNHAGPKDAERSRELLADYDVFIPETPGWNARDREAVRDLSAGKINVVETIKHLGFTSDHPEYDRRKAEYERLYGTNKAVVFVDVPEKNPILSKMESARYAYLFRNILNGSFEHAIDLVKHAIQAFAQSQQEREAFIMEHIPAALKEAIAYYPELKNKEKLKVLIELGAAHTPLFHSMKVQGKEVSHEFGGRMPIEFHIRDEATRRLTFGKEMGDNFLAKVVLEKLFYMNYDRVTLKNEQLERIDIREIANILDINEIRVLFEKAKSGSQDFADALAEILLTKGLLK